jgi:type IV pilus assembly protein PilB
MTPTGLGHARMGEILVSSGLIEEATLAKALEIQRQSGGLLGEVLVHQLMATEEQIADVLAKQRGLERVNLAVTPIQREAVLLLPERMERMRQLIPIERRDTEIVVAMANPLDIEALDDVRMRTGLTVKPVVATASQIVYAIDKYVTSADAVKDMFASGVEIEEEDVDIAADDAPVVRVVGQLFHDAVLDDASDIHIEPTKKNVRVRFRVDGVLHDVMELPKFAHAGIVSRIKVLADMDLAERRRPQDGRITAQVEGKPVDLRIATVPTPDGESVVIRVLNQQITFLTLSDLGMGAEDLEKMNALLKRPYGSVFVAGPTGAGKSTTLYASLSILNEPTRKIVTIEDPIEYRLAGITQIPVNPGIGLTFASLLRQVVRFDPDVVMVGEVRDHDTAEISARAALTGHLVLSSIHTNDAPSALTRMTDMGVPNYVTSSAMLGVVAQRLVRRLCGYCKQPDDVPYEALIQAGFPPEEAATIMPMRAVGCDKCLNSGYKGRDGLFEIMVMNDELRRLFLREAAADDLRRVAVEGGMKTLRRDGLDKVAAGVTTLSELARVVAY